MNSIFDTSRNQILILLGNYLGLKKKEFNGVNLWAKDAFTRVEAYVQNGKMVRGGLVMLAAGMFGKRAGKDAVKVAAAVELIHAAFLIQDDVMDRDLLRRGKKTIHAQYTDIGQGKSCTDSLHFGEGMAVCVSDLVFFAAFDLLASVKDKMVAQKLIQYYAKEFSNVALGQMQDVYFGCSPAIPQKKDVFSIYKYKTARYTFSLPLAAGALLGGASKRIIETLETLGEDLGIIFQIKDDELGLFGDEKKIGKPVGSDIKEGKKTLFYLALLDVVTPTEREKLSHIFGNPGITEGDVQYVRGLIETHEIRKEVLGEVNRYYNRAKKKIDTLPVETKYRALLQDLLEFNLMRTK